MVFQRPPHLPFAGKLVRGLQPNALILRIQPDEASRCALERRSLAGLPRPHVAMDFSYKDAFGTDPPRPTNGSCLTRSTATRRCSSAPTRWNRPGGFSSRSRMPSWRLSPPLPLRRGHVGPLEAARLLEPDGYEWVNPECRPPVS